MSTSYRRGVAHAIEVMSSMKEQEAVAVVHHGGPVVLEERIPEAAVLVVAA